MPDSFNLFIHTLCVPIMQAAQFGLSVLPLRSLIWPFQKLPLTLQRVPKYADIIKAFRALSFQGNRQFSIREGSEQSSNAHACRISTPRQGVSIFDKAWEWTVYFSDRRLAMPP